MARRRRWSRDERNGVLAAHAASGLSLWAFARESGLPYTTLVHWGRRGVTGPAPRLVPVEVERREVGHLEVLVGGAVVRVGCDFDAELLARVVRALRTC